MIKLIPIYLIVIDFNIVSPENINNQLIEKLRVLQQEQSTESTSTDNSSESSESTDPGNQIPNTGRWNSSLTNNERQNYEVFNL